MEVFLWEKADVSAVFPVFISFDKTREKEDTDIQVNRESGELRPHG